MCVFLKKIKVLQKNAELLGILRGYVGRKGRFLNKGQSLARVRVASGERFLILLAIPYFSRSLKPCFIIGKY
jgi:hypothetical protein